MIRQAYKSRQQLQILDHSLVFVRAFDSLNAVGMEREFHQIWQIKNILLMLAVICVLDIIMNIVR